MSSIIHNLEPQAFGLIVFKTTFGELELELFTKQCPKISQNFVQLCLDGYYNNTVFHRVERDFIAIGGRLDYSEKNDNTIDTGTCPDEFHSRLKFSRRGLLATANTDKNVNGPEFFFSLGPTPELQNKHSIFGRLKGDSVYHLVDLNECPVDDDLVPISEKKILQTVVIENPFPDLKARPHIVQALDKHRNKITSGDKQDEEHDYLEPKLQIKSSTKKLSFYEDDSDEEAGDKTPAPRDDEINKELQQVDDQFKKPSPRASPNSQLKPEENNSSAEDARQRKLREIREQIQSIKKQIECDSATKIRTLSDRRRSQGQDSSMAESMRSSSSKQSSVEDPDLSNQELRLATKKGRHRERETLELMENFRKRLKDTSKSRNQPKTASNPSDSVTATKMQKAGEEAETGSDEEDFAKALELVEGDAWMRHKFDASGGAAPRDAKDANQKGDDWYSIEDPRNPTVQRVEADKAREYAKHRSREDKLDDDRYRSRSPSRDSKHHHRHSSRHQHR